MKEALHMDGTILSISQTFDLRKLRLLADSGYTHVRTPSWAWGSGGGSWQPIGDVITAASVCP